jgi:DNA-binding PadR family transcriptional regulator
LTAGVSRYIVMSRDSAHINTTIWSDIPLLHEHLSHLDRRRHRRSPHPAEEQGRGFGPPAGLGGPGRHRGGMVRRGEVRPLILVALANKPMHGYEVIQALEAQSGGRWRPSAGSIYPTLQQLADEGLITGSDLDGRRVYSVTDEGRAAAEAAPPTPWSGDQRGESHDIRRLGRQVVEAAMQVQRVGSANAATAAEVILLDTRAKLYGLLAADGGGTEEDRADDEPVTPRETA